MEIPRSSGQRRRRRESSSGGGCTGSRHQPAGPRLPLERMRAEAAGPPCRERAASALGQGAETRGTHAHA
eukprot:6825631-Pyramimonas_sp.AAC.1